MRFLHEFSGVRPLGPGPGPPLVRPAGHLPIVSAWWSAVGGPIGSWDARGAAPGRARSAIGGPADGLSSADGPLGGPAVRAVTTNASRVATTARPGPVPPTMAPTPPAATRPHGERACR